MVETSNKLPKGVVLDRGRIRAKIHIQGQQTWLGTFATVEEASAAYEAVKATTRRAKAERVKPEPRRLGAEQRASIEADARHWHASYKGQPEPTTFAHPHIEGETLPDAFRVPRDDEGAPQLFRFVRKTWRFFGGRQWALWEWYAVCRHAGCDERYTVTTPGALERMGVPSAYCKAHRRPGRPRRVDEAGPHQREGGRKAVQGPEKGPGGDVGLEARAKAELLGIGDLV